MREEGTPYEQTDLLATEYALTCQRHVDKVLSGRMGQLIQDGVDVYGILEPMTDAIRCEQPPEEFIEEVFSKEIKACFEQNNMERVRQGLGGKKNPKMPEQKPGRSKQDYETPKDFMDAVEARFGKMSVDLAASPHNAKATLWIDKKRDALTVEWSKEYTGNMWINPPFGSISLWAQMAMLEKGNMGEGSRIFLLTPASVGANWYWSYIHKHALVLALTPRITFVGEIHPYPKDLILSVFGEPPGFERWKWWVKCKKS